MAWSNPTNVFVDDGNVASDTADATTFLTGLLFVTGFGFSVAGSAIIQGITVDVLASASATGLPSLTAALTLDGTTVYGAARAISPGTTLSFSTWGTSNDLWGNSSLTPAQVNASTFGIIIQGNGQTVGGGTFNVDYLRMTIYLQPGIITLGSPAAGNITLSSGRSYTLVFRNSATKHYSDVIKFSTSTGPLTSNNQPLSNLPICADPQVDRKTLLATGDGGDEETLYEVADIPNTQTTYTDNTDEPTLLLANIFAQVADDGTDIGVFNNTPPPIDGRYPIRHRGRIYMLSGQKRLYFSKSEDELLTSTGIVVGKFEECWPADNYFDISEEAVTGTGLLSDGSILYIGTDRNVVKLFGTGPSDFLKPQLLFTNVGVMNQDVWQMVFLEGNPLGAMWLTPDMHVLGSDFNTYQDVGVAIQDVLNSVNRTPIMIGTTSTNVATAVSWSMYASRDVFNLYVLAVPTGSNTKPDTLLVYDLKGRRWFEWQTNDQLVGGVFNITAAGIPQIVVLAASGKVYQFDPTTLQDRVGDTPLNFNVTIQTTWQDMTDPAARKMLNEIEIITGDPALTLTVEGASTKSDFDSPHVVVANSPLLVKPRGEYFVPLAGKVTRDRYYRYTINASDQGTDVLRGLNVEGVVTHRV